MRFYLGALFIIVFAALGIKHKRNYNARKNFFREFYLFNNMMSAEMSFGRRTIKQVYSQANFQSMFKDVLDSFISGAKITLSDSLTVDEKAYITSYFELLGKSDANSQQKMLNQAEPYIKKFSEDSFDKAQKYGKLSLRLGILFGLMAFILII